MLSQGKSKRKPSGGRIIQGSVKKKRELSKYPIMTRLEDKKLKVQRTIGGNKKNKLKSANFVNVALKDGSIKKTEIKNVIDNSANKHLVRRNILTKGAVVETSLGNVKLTSRPGQDGNVNGILIK